MNRIGLFTATLILIAVQMSCIVGTKPAAPLPPGDIKDPLVLCGGNTEVLSDHTIRNAEDVLAMAGCETLIGTLVVERSDLVTLEGLEGLREIDGYLYVADNPALTSLEGLENLRTVRGGIGLVNNPLLENARFSSLEEIENTIGLIDNAALTDIDFGDVELIQNGSIEVEGNASLEDFDGFSSVVEIDGSLIVNRNDALESFEGFEDLERIGGALVVGLSVDDNGNPLLAGNASLQNLEGLESLESVQSMAFADNDDLENMEGLEVLEVLPGSLVFFNNPELRDFEGMETLTSIGGDFTLGLSRDTLDDPLPLGNESLRNFNGLTELAEIGGSLTVAFNGLENFEGLEALTTISGDLLVVGNEDLENFVGAETLTTLGGDFVIGELRDALNNPQAAPNGLEDFAGLDGLAALNGRFIVAHSSVEDFAGLENLQSVAGLFNVYDSDVESFTGLTALTQTADLIVGAVPDAEGVLLALGNDALENVDGLEALSAAADVRFLFNEALTDLGGLSALTAPSGVVHLAGNTDLRDVDLALTSCGGLLIGTVFDAVGLPQDNANGLDDLGGLSALSQVNGDFLWAFEDTALELPALASVSGDFSILDATGFSNFSVLTALTSVGVLDISGTELTSLDGLALTNIDDDLRLEENELLDDVDSLSSLVTVGGDVLARNNASLSDDDLEDAVGAALEGDFFACGNDDSDIDDCD